MRLGRRMLLWTYHNMGLPGTEGSPLNAGIYPQGTALFQTPHPDQTTGPTIPPLQAQLRSQDATHGGRRTHPPPSIRRAQTNYSGGLRHFSFSRTRHQRRHPPGTQRPCLATSATNREHNETMQIVFGPHGISGRANPHIQSIGHGTRRPQQRVLFIQTQGLQPRRGTHVYVRERQHPRK